MAKDSEQIKTMSLRKMMSIQGDHNLLESKIQAERTLEAKAITYNHLYSHSQYK